MLPVNFSVMQLANAGQRLPAWTFRISGRHRPRRSPAGTPPQHFRRRRWPRAPSRPGAPLCLVWRGQALRGPRRGGRERDTGGLTGPHRRVMDGGAAPGCRRGPPRGRVHGQGPRPRAWAGARPRWPCPSRGDTPSRELTAHRCEGARRARGAAGSASDSHRMRADEGAGLLERVMGPPGRSAPPRPPGGVAQAGAGRRPGQRARQAAPAAPP